MSALMAPDAGLHAYPVHDSMTVACGGGAIQLTYPDVDGTAAVPYGSAFFVDVPTGRSERIGNRRACVSALEVYRPGPFLDGEGVAS